MVGISGVNIVDAVVDGVAEHADCFRLIDVGTVALTVQIWKAHAAEAEHRSFPVKGSKLAILHGLSFFPGFRRGFYPRPLADGCDLAIVRALVWVDRKSTRLNS